jgi:hypothetical protein
MEAAFARQPFRDVFNREVVLFLMNEGDVRGAMEHFRRLAARVAGVCVSGGGEGGGYAISTTCVGGGGVAGEHGGGWEG